MIIYQNTYILTILTPKCDILPPTLLWKSNKSLLFFIFLIVTYIFCNLMLICWCCSMFRWLITKKIIFWPFWHSFDSILDAILDLRVKYCPNHKNKDRIRFFSMELVEKVVLNIIPWILWLLVLEYWLTLEGAEPKGQKKVFAWFFPQGTRRFWNLTYRPMIISKETNLRKNSRKIVVLDLSIHGNWKIFNKNEFLKYFWVLLAMSIL